MIKKIKKLIINLNKKLIKNINKLIKNLMKKIINYLIIKLYFFKLRIKKNYLLYHILKPY